MSVMPLDLAETRILSANEPLAVFAVPKRDDLVNVVFAGTVRTTRWIRQQGEPRQDVPRLLGVFDRNSDPQQVRDACRQVAP